MADCQINQGIPSNNLALFALKGSDEFGQSIARRLGLPLALHEEREFADGEHKCRPLENVHNKDVYIVHSLHTDARHSCNDKLCRMLFFIGVVKDASAARPLSSIVAPPQDAYVHSWPMQAPIALSVWHDHPMRTFIGFLFDRHDSGLTDSAALAAAVELPGSSPIFSD